MLLIAEALPDPQSPAAVGWLIISVGVVVQILVGVATLAALHKKQKREVSIAHDAATKAELERLIVENRQEHQQIFAKMGGMERGLREELKNDVSKLHEKMNGVAQDVSGLNRVTELQNRQLERIEHKLDKRGEA